MVIGILEAYGDTFGESWRVIGCLFCYLGGSLGYFFWSWRLLGGPCGTKWLPEVTFLDFGYVLGSILGGFWGPGWGLGGHLGAFWWPLGELWVFFFGFVLESVKLLKNVVLLK